MRLLLVLALPALAAGVARADGFEQPLDAVLRKIHFERGDRDRDERRGHGGDWIDRLEREDRRRRREHDEWERRWQRDHPERPRVPRDRGDQGPVAAPAPAPRPAWGRRYGDWDETYHSGWRRDPRGAPLWWGWALWTRDSDERCEAYYETLESRCEAACGDERSACGDTCSDQDRLCRISCDEEKTENVNARCP